MPSGIPGNFGVPATQGVSEFARFRSPLPQSFNIPFVPYDWSMPPQVVATRRVENQDQNLSLTLLPTTLAPFTKSNVDWMRQQQVQVRSIEAQQNLLITLQSLNPTFLFRDPTVTNVRYITPRRTYEVDQNLALTLLTTTLAPFTRNNLDWMRQQQVQIRSIEPEQNRIILPTTLAPLVLANDDTSRLRSITRHQETAEQNLLLTVPPLTLAPFTTNNLDWMRQQQVQVRSSEPEQNRSILSTTLAPFTTNNLDWMRQQQVQVRSDDEPQNLLLTLLAPSVVAATPFVATTWEQRTVMVGRLVNETTNLLLSLLPTTLAPFVNENWPAPPRITPRAEDPYQNLLLTLLATISALAPFAPTEWVTTTPQQVRRKEDGYVNMLLLGIPPPPVVVLPFSSYDWVQSRQPLVFKREDSTYNFLALGIPPFIPPDSATMTWYHIPHVTRTGL